jgi:hypothetical protein
MAKETIDMNMPGDAAGKCLEQTPMIPYMS